MRGKDRGDYLVTHDGLLADLIFQFNDQIEKTEHIREQNVNQILGNKSTE
jgi:hypothetical protein